MTTRRTLPLLVALGCAASAAAEPRTPPPTSSEPMETTERAATDPAETVTLSVGDARARRKSIGLSWRYAAPTIHFGGVTRWFRFEPDSHRLTSFGTYHSTNPWGVTFDDWGQHVASHPIFAAAFHALDPP